MTEVAAAQPPSTQAAAGSDDETRRRLQAIEQLFNLWDLDGNGSVSWTELHQVLQSLKQQMALMGDAPAAETGATTGGGDEPAPQPLKGRGRSGSIFNAPKRVQNRFKWVSKMEAKMQHEVRDAHGSLAQAGRARSTSMVKMASGGTLNFFDGIDGEPSLDPEGFSNFMMACTSRDTNTEFDDFITGCTRSIREVANSTMGNEKKRQVWELFQLLDTNHDGFVELSELDMLFHADKKKDQKLHAKWKHHLVSKERQKKCADGATNSDQQPQVTEESVKMHLQDFHEFIDEYCTESKTDFGVLVANVKATVRSRHIDYVNVHDIPLIMNEIMEDLLKSRPHDVLAGIMRSAERLKRTGKFPPKKLDGAKK